MKKFGMEEERARRQAVKELTRVSDKIRDKKQVRLRMKQQVQKVEVELVNLSATLEKNLAVIHGMIAPSTQNTQK